MRARIRTRPWSRLELVLIFLGAVALGVYGASQLQPVVYQWYENRQLDTEASAPVEPPPQDAGVVRPVPELPEDGLIGRISIPRLRLSTTVREGDDEGTLARAAGHVPGSAIPGQFGNIAIAAHRDSFFRPLREVRKDDRIQIKTRYGTFTYEVESTSIVKPSDTSVLQPTKDSTLTLITCYPFWYVGNAPKRYIVKAREVQAVPSESARLVRVKMPASPAATE